MGVSNESQIGPEGFSCDDDIQLRNSNRYCLCRLSLDQVIQFRKSTGDDLWILPDKWDECGEHIGFKVGDTIKAVIRINKPEVRVLPINDILDHEINSEDIQIGRLLIAPDSRGTRIVLVLVKAFQNHLDGYHGNIFATPLAESQGGMSAEFFEKFGFVRIGDPISCSGRNLIPMLREPKVRDNLRGST